MRRAVTCPKGCGSTTFSAARHAVIVEDFTIDDETGEVVLDGKMAEGGGKLTLRCECGHSWETVRDLNLALVVEER